MSGLNFLFSRRIRNAQAVTIKIADIDNEMTIPIHADGSKNLSALFITICTIPKEAKPPKVIAISDNGIVWRIIKEVRSLEFILRVLSTKSSFPFILQTCPATANEYSIASKANTADAAAHIG